MKLTIQTFPESARLQGYWVTANGLRLHAQVATANCAQPLQPFVLVPGLGMSHRYFVPLASQLARNADVYVLDLPGHGRSESGAWIRQLEQLSDTLHAWLDAAGLEQAIFVGNSLGSQIVTDCALRFPHRVAGLALLGATFDPRAESIPALVARVLRTGLHEKLSLYPLLTGDYLRALPRLVAEYRMMLADKIGRKLPQVRVPVLHVRGEHDFISPADWTRQLCDKSGCGAMITIAGAAHAVHFTKPEEVANSLLRFFHISTRGADLHLPELTTVLSPTQSDL